MLAHVALAVTTLQPVNSSSLKTQVLSDEVYEHLTFPGGAPHVSIRSLPGMARRTLRLGSAGKTFSLTAWKVGWMEGPAELLAPCVKVREAALGRIQTYE